MTTQPLTFTAPITTEMQAIAHHISQQHGDQSRQIYLNLLAVKVVEHCFKYLNIETDWAASLSAHPVLHALTATADLVLPGVGTLECCPVLADASHATVPREAWEERWGYVIVQIDEIAHQAEILGFSPTAGTGELAIDRLAGLEVLFERIGEQEQQQSLADGAELPSESPSQPWVFLGDRLDRAWAQLTQTAAEMADFLTPEQDQWQIRALAPIPVLRSTALKPASPHQTERLPELESIRRLNLATALGGESLELAILSRRETATTYRLSVLVRAYGQEYLPPGLRLGLRSETGETIPGLEDSVSTYGYSTLRLVHPFGIDQGDCFILYLQLGDEIVREYLRM